MQPAPDSRPAPAVDPRSSLSEPLAQPLAPALQAAAQQAAQEGLAFAGHVAPDAAWALVQAGQAWLVDVRSPEELRFVGSVPGAWAVPWATGLDLQGNPDFLFQLAETVAQAQAQTGGGSRPLLLLCRSGVRSIRAAEAATAAGHPAAFNVLEGFEGRLDAGRQRGHLEGWRRRGLPWEQG